MKSRSLSLLAVAAALVAPAAVPVSASAPVSASVTAPASVSVSVPASVSAPVSVPEAVPLDPYAGWPREPSTKPKAEEWRGALRVPLLRPNRFCDASRVREWLRVSCRFVRGGPEAQQVVQLTGLRVVGGSAADVELQDRPPDPGQPLVDQYKNRIPHGIVVIFPVRPGDRRLIEMVEPVFEGRYTVGENAAAMLSALWLPSDPGPTIVLH